MILRVGVHHLENHLQIFCFDLESNGIKLINMVKKYCLPDMCPEHAHTHTHTHIHHPYTTHTLLEQMLTKRPGVVKVVNTFG